MGAFDKVIGYEEIKSELIRYCDVLRNIDRYKAFGITPPRGVLLYGKPGVGKTLMTKCFVEESGLNSFLIRKEKSNVAFVDHIKSVFEEARVSEPAIVLLDDLDKFANEDDCHRNAEEYVTVQSCIDDIDDHLVFVLATANDIHNLPDSLLRTGRFDKVINMTISACDLEAIFKHYLSEVKMIGSTSMQSRTMGSIICLNILRRNCKETTKRIRYE